jgi:dCMP deaminase
VIVHLDGVVENNHPLNLRRVDEGREASSFPVRIPTRIPLFEVYMRMAEELAKRSSCARAKVGTVITDAGLSNVLGIGYNGNAAGLPNRCDSTEAGRCGCIHSEMNALVKASGLIRDKVVFVTMSPCVMCAKLIIQSGVTHVFYREAYRDPAGLEVLRAGRVDTILYNRWAGEWR